MATTTNIGLTKPAGTDKALVSVINSNSDIIDSAAGGLMDAIAIVANGNTHAAISAGQYVYVHNHGTLAEGLYTANSAIAANATLTTSNLTADASGGLNALNSKLIGIANPSTRVSNIDTALTTGIYAYASGASGTKPKSGGGVLYVNAFSDSYVHQIASPYDSTAASPELYSRIIVGSTIGAWQQLVLKSEFATVSSSSTVAAGSTENVSYPTGFTRDTCVVVSVYYTTSSTRQFKNVSASLGSSNVILSNDDSSARSITAVLMKV